MAKKGRKTSKRTDTSNEPNLDVGESKKRIRDFEDVADSDEEFHLNRDKVLLDEEPEAKRRRVWQEQEQFLEPSDEEVLNYSASDSGNEAATIPKYDRNGTISDSEDADGAEDDEDEYAWGTSKDDLYGADEIETEEQALEEEAEALRLQKKQLQSMTAADYGFDPSEWQDEGVDTASVDGINASVITEVLPQLQVDRDMSHEDRLSLLVSRYPEFEPLRKELPETQEHFYKLADELKAKGNGVRREDFPNLRSKMRAAAGYLATLTMYFVLLASPAADGDPEVLAMSASQLRDHAVMDSLLTVRKIYLRAKKLPADQPQSEDTEQEGSSGDDVVDSRANKAPATQHVKRHPAQKSKAQRHADAAEARRAERMARTEAGLANLDDLVALSGNKKFSKLRKQSDESDMDDEVQLTAREAEEKAKRKKSLRFYTSQIAQKANKRGAAGRSAGGDDDIPHRERLRDRQARLNAEAEKRGQKDARVDLGDESDEEDARQAEEIRAGEEDDYYNLVAARTAKKKADKAALTEAQKQAALEGGRVIPEETVGPDGKRKITYAIEKNKGLTPHRKKDVRNPRVKKRKKFDEKKKKLASIKPVYKGGEGRGGYAGELTGIKKNLVKSTKL